MTIENEFSFWIIHHVPEERIEMIVFNIISLLFGYCIKSIEVTSTYLLQFVWSSFIIWFSLLYFENNVNWNQNANQGIKEYRYRNDEWFIIRLWSTLSNGKNKENIMKLNIIKKCAEHQKNTLISYSTFCCNFPIRCSTLTRSKSSCSLFYRGREMI